MKRTYLMLALLAAATIAAVSINVTRDGAPPAEPGPHLVLERGAEARALAGSLGEAECVEAGGSWTWVQSHFMSCVLPFADAGASCSSQSECEGGCIVQDFASQDARSGQCAADTSTTGCIGAVEGGPIRCLDDDIMTLCERGSELRRCAAL